MMLSKPKFATQKLITILIATVALLLLPIACSNSEETALNNTTSESEPIRIRESSTPSATKIPTPTPQMILTLTSTVLLTPTHFPTEEPEPTALPTLPPEEARTVILALLENHDNCRLPCWWGFTPGVTSWEVANHFLETIAVSIDVIGNPSTGYSAYVKIPQAPLDIYEASFQHVYSIENDEANTIEEIEVHWLNHAPYSLYTLDEILEEFGEPADVRIKANKFAVGASDFVVYLFYPEDQFLIRFSYDGILQDEVIHTCLPQDGFVGITIWSPEYDGTPFEEILGSEMFTQSGELFVRPLEEATEMTIPSFNEEFKTVDESESCLESPAHLWPNIPNS